MATVRLHTVTGFINSIKETNINNISDAHEREEKTAMNTIQRSTHIRRRSATIIATIVTASATSAVDTAAATTQ